MTKHDHKFVSSLESEMNLLLDQLLEPKPVPAELVEYDPLVDLVGIYRRELKSFGQDMKAFGDGSLTSEQIKQSEETFAPVDRILRGWTAPVKTPAGAAALLGLVYDDLREDLGDDCFTTRIVGAVLAFLAPETAEVSQ